MLYTLARIAEIRQELNEQDYEIAALSQLFEAASDSGRADYAWSAGARLTAAYFGMGQFDAGLYFVEQADRWWQRYQEQPVTLGHEDDYAALLAAVARALFYERKDYQGALRWAQRALEIAPGEPDALRVRGFAHSKLDEYPAAADAYRAWIAAEPANAAARNNLANALVGLGDSDAAVKALTEAVRLDPATLPFRLNLASLLRNLGRFDEAVTELDALISIGNEQERTEPPADAQPFVTSRTMRRTRRRPTRWTLPSYSEPRSIWNATVQTVAHDIEDLLTRPDPLTNAVGLQYRGQLCERKNDLAGALVAYEEAIATGGAPADLYADQARLLLRLGRKAEALHALEELAAPDRDPARAITGLDELLACRTSDPGVLRVRGIANFHAWHAQAARADLKAAIDGGESDWRTYRMFGLSLILISPTEDEPTGISIQGALEALNEAVLRSAGTDDADAAEAARTLRWLLDRAFGTTAWLDHLAGLVESGGEPPWRSAFPDLTPALLRQAQAIRLEEIPDWRAAAAAWEQAQALFADAGFPVTAARTSINIADNKLRLYELDAVATHLEIAEKALPLTARPLTAGLDEDYAGQPGIASFEVDYLPAYGIGISEYTNMMRLLRIQLDARSGSYAAATARIEDAEWLFAALGTADLAPGVSVPAVVGIAQILRRANQRPLAVALLKRICTEFQGTLQSRSGPLWPPSRQMTSGYR